MLQGNVEACAVRAVSALASAEGLANKVWVVGDTRAGAGYPEVPRGTRALPVFPDRDVTSAAALGRRPLQLTQN